MSKFFVALAVSLACFTAEARAQMSVHVIDVGQAESLLIELPHHAILVDAGVERTTTNRYEGQLKDYLDRFFARRTDLNATLYGVVISHPHIDHTVRLGTIFTDYRVQNFIEGGGSTGSGIEQINSARGALAAEGATHIRVRFDTANSQAVRAWAATVEQEDGARIRFLSGKRTCNDENNESLVMRVEFGQKSFLLTGDSEQDDLDRNKPGDEGCGGLLPFLLIRYRQTPELLRANVYKVGHHGARNGTYDGFARAVAPDYAVISAGDFHTQAPTEFHGFFFGHPNETALRVLERFVMRDRDSSISAFTMRGPGSLIRPRQITKGIFCTCWDSNVVFTVNQAGNDLKVTPNAP
jgi:competence protein ComEC